MTSFAELSRHDLLLTFMRERIADTG